MLRAIVRFLRREDGVTAVEYAAGAAALILVTAASVSVMNRNARPVMSTVTVQVGDPQGTFGSGT